MSGDALAEVLALRAAGDYRRAREVAAASAASGAAGPALLTELGRLHEELGDLEAAAATLRQALAAAEDVAGPERAGLVAVAAARLAAVLRWEGDVHAAAPLAGRALEEAEGPGAVPASVRSLVLVEAAHLQQELGEHGTAHGLLERAVAAADEAPAGTERDGAMAIAVGALGDGHRRQGRYADAEPLLQEAIALAERAFGPSSLEVANLLNALGICRKFSGRFDEAGPVYRRALGVLTAAFGTEEHSDVASLYHNLGGLEHARRRFDAAEPYARRSVEIRERMLGPDHVHTAADRAALASILDALGRPDEAEPLFRDAIATFERVHGPDHYEVAVNLNNLAAVHQRRGDLDEAEALYRRALAVKERVLGPDSPETAITLNNLAVVLRATGDLAGAEALYRRALDVLERGVEPSHPTIARTLRNYARLLRAGGRDDEAAALDARAEVSSRRLTGDGDAGTMST